jgi:hypothetical protein
MQHKIRSVKNAVWQKVVKGLKKICKKALRGDHKITIPSLGGTWYNDVMPRKARIGAPGALQHIVIRRIERERIFVDDQDRDISLNGWVRSSATRRLSVLPGR